MRALVEACEHSCVHIAELRDLRRHPVNLLAQRHCHATVALPLVSLPTRVQATAELKAITTVLLNRRHSACLGLTERSPQLVNFT